MLPPWVQVLLVLMQEYWSARRSAQIQLLKLQVELLRQKLPGNPLAGPSATRSPSTPSSDNDPAETQSSSSIRQPREPSESQDNPAL